MKNQKGFTLMELLVVMALIAMAASVVMMNLGESRKKARDAARKEALYTIRKSLELYYNENSYYPTNANEVNGWDVSYIGSPEFIPDIASIAGTVPVDPLNNDTYYYMYRRFDEGAFRPACPAFYIIAASALESTTDLQPATINCGGVNYDAGSYGQFIIGLEG